MTTGQDSSQVVTISAVLSGLLSYARDGYGLYVPLTRRRQRGDPRSVWDLSPEDPCAVLDIYETDDPDDDPAFAKTHGLTYACLVDAVVEIKTHAANQLGREPDVRELVIGLNFYLNSDAFVDWTKISS